MRITSLDCTLKYRYRRYFRIQVYLLISERWYLSNCTLWLLSNITVCCSCFCCFSHNFASQNDCFRLIVRKTRQLYEQCVMLRLAMVLVTKERFSSSHCWQTLNSNSICAISRRLVVYLLYSKYTTNLRLIAQMEFEYYWKSRSCYSVVLPVWCDGA